MIFIVHPSLEYLKNRGFFRTLRNDWYENIEVKYSDASVGESFLVNRDVRCDNKNTTCWEGCVTCSGEKIVWDYGSVRKEDGWERRLVVYPKGEVAPYSFHNEDDWNQKMMESYQFVFQHRYWAHTKNTNYPSSITDDIKKFVSTGVFPEYW